MYGKLSWLACTVRLDIIFAISLLGAVRNGNATILYWKGLLRVYGYIKNTLDYDISFWLNRNYTNVLAVYCDADFANSKYMRSRTWLVIMFLGNIIYYKSKKQPNIAQNTFQEKLNSICAGNKTITVVYLNLLKTEISVPFPLKIYNHNQALAQCATLAKKQTKKHMNVKLEWLKESVWDNIICVHCINGDANPADIFTKHLDRYTFEKHLQTMNFKLHHHSIKKTQMISYYENIDIVEFPPPKWPKYNPNIENKIKKIYTIFLDLTCLNTITNDDSPENSNISGEYVQQVKSICGIRVITTDTRRPYDPDASSFSDSNENE